MPTAGDDVASPPHALLPAERSQLCPQLSELLLHQPCQVEALGLGGELPWTSLSSTRGTGCQDVPGQCPSGDRVSWDGGGEWAVWPLFMRIPFGFFIEVYDLPAFQDPTTHKFKVAMKFLFLWASWAGAS